MAQTVIGIFDYTSEAQAAVEYLENNGFSRGNIDIASRSQDDDDNDNDSFGEGISNFFSKLFGSDNDEAKKYSEAGRKGSVVTVHVESSEEAKRAAEILDQYGAIDVDERVLQHTHAENVGGTTSARGTGVAGGTVYTGSGNLAGESERANRITDTSPEMDLGKGTYQNVHAENVGGTTADSRMDVTARTPSDETTASNLRSDLGRTSETDSTKSIPIIEENLEVGKRVVEGGTTRIRSRIVEQPVEENIRLRTERVNIERTPVDRPASSSDISNFREETIEETERTEVPVVNKDSRVVEEVSLNKDIDEREETIRDTVRSTEVDVDKTDDDDEIRRRRAEGYRTDTDRNENI
jgi:stress response protein YsnF